MITFTSISNAMNALARKKILGFEIVRNGRVAARVRSWRDGTIQQKFIGHTELESSGAYASLAGSDELDGILLDLINFVKRAKDRKMSVVIRELCESAATAT